MEPVTTAPEAFVLGSFLARWSRLARYDLSGSESATLTLTALLGMAELDDRRRWRDLSLGYADPRGAPWLRSEIASRHAGLAIDNVLCCAGAQEGMTCVMQALLARGDHAIVIVPIYQPSERAVTSLCMATGVPLEDRGHLDIGRVAAAIRPETKLVVMNFPNSPTGESLDPTLLKALVELCRHRGLWLVNDEVYGLMADDPSAGPAAIADIYERGVSINAVSKAFGLPGLRVGWVVCRDQQLLAKVLTIKSRLSSYLAAPAEVLAHIALRAETSIIEQNKTVARANLRLLRIFLCRHPDIFEDVAPGNLAFAAPRYLGANGAERFAVDLVRNTGVLLLPSGLWRSRLAHVPVDRVRVRLGDAGIGPALAAIEAHLMARSVNHVTAPIQESAGNVALIAERHASV